MAGRRGIGEGGDAQDAKRGGLDAPAASAEALRSFAAEVAVAPKGQLRAPLEDFLAWAPRPPSPLEKIQPDGWLAEYIEDLLNLLDGLGRLVALEPRPADLMERIVAGPLVTIERGEPEITDEAPSP